MNKGAGRGRGRGSPEMGCGARGVPATLQGLSLPGWDARRCQDHRSGAHTGTPARAPLHPGRCRGARPGASPVGTLSSPWDALWSRQLLVLEAHTTVTHRAAGSRKPPTKDQGRACLSRSRCFQALGLRHAQQGSAEWTGEEEEFSRVWGTTRTSSITTAGAGGNYFPQYQQGLTYFKCSQTTLSPMPIYDYILRHFLHGQFSWKSLFY